MTTNAKTYEVRFIHKIAPRDTDIGDPVKLSDDDLKDHKTLGQALRKQGALIAGGRVRRNWRVEQDGRVVVFPTVAGLTTYWHSIVLIPVEEK